MISSNDAARIEGATAYDSAGEKVGKVGQLYLDDQTNEPSWVSVNTGLFGTSQSLVPLEGASFDGDDLRLAQAKERIKDAPRVEADQHLDRDEEDRLYRHYGLGAGAGYAGTTGTTTDTTTGTGTAGVVGDETSTVVNEERLRAGTESREAGRARLRKYTTTDTETVSVPVTKEKLVVERTPVEGTATSAPIQEGEQVEEITLREERAVVDKETVAVEEVSLAKEEVTEQERVSADVKREHVDIDVDGDLDRGTDGPLGGTGRDSGLR